MDEQREAWIEGFLDETISESEAALLLSAIRCDGAFRSEMADHLVLHGALQQLHEEPTAAGNILSAIDEARADRTAKSVLSSLMKGRARDEIRQPHNRSSRRLTAPRADSARQDRPTGSQRQPSSRRSRRVRRSRPLLRLLAIPLAAASIVLIAHAYNLRMLQSTRHNLQATVVHVKGTVRLRRSGVDGIVQPGTTIEAGDSLHTGSDGTANLRYSDGTEILVSTETRLQLQDTTEGRRNRSLYLEQGELTAIVKPQPTDRPLTTETPHAAVQVVGTRFILLAEPDMTRIQVTEGKVSFGADIAGRNTVVATGQEGRASRDGVRVVRQSCTMLRADPQVVWNAADRSVDLLRAAPEQAARYLAANAAAAARGEAQPGRLLRQPQRLVRLLPEKDGAFARKPNGEYDWTRPDEAYFHSLNERIAMAGAYGIRLQITLLDNADLHSLRIPSESMGAATAFAHWLKPYVDAWRDAGHEFEVASGMLPVGTSRNAVNFCYALEAVLDAAPKDNSR